ncbi:hypothetical protein F0U61_10240 [Archangium violaceum]|uniref:hypothetical protein n=1 Tax=Archangium violaceum TaxID=83451 RepID=UPI002B2C2CFC|nr:hypothetical protein F0U61_10240 [Archangium violaceum]
MEFLLLILLMPLPIYGVRANDPIAGPWQSKEEARNLECTRLSQAQAHERYPDLVPDLPARGTSGVTDALACTSRFMRYGERPDRDEVILSSLGQSVGEITQIASALGSGELTWHVDAFYPEPAVAAKISVAARTQLAERGHKVSDRVPVLAAGDIAVLGRMPASKAYPLACARYFAQRVLDEQDAFLGLMIIDARETQLHAGLCMRGEWRWLQ